MKIITYSFPLPILLQRYLLFLLMYKCSLYFLKNVLKIFIYLFLERREGERDGEKHQSGVASHMPPTGPIHKGRSTTQACALTLNRRGDPQLCRPVRNLLSHASQGTHYILRIPFFFKFFLLSYILQTFQFTVCLLFLAYGRVVFCFCFFLMSLALAGVAQRIE